jgi:Uma2 family endonuclease
MAPRARRLGCGMYDGMNDVDACLNERLRPLRVKEYEALAAMGVFEDQKVELIRGRVVWMAPHGEEHAWAVEQLNNQLVKVFGHVASVRPQLPINASDDSMPEPDLALVPKRSAPGPHPSRTFLIIEVAQSSLRMDRLVKAPLYAEGAAPEYWIVDVNENVLEVYRAPKDGVFTERTLYHRGDVVHPVAFPEIGFPLRDVLVPAAH